MKINDIIAGIALIFFGIFFLLDNFAIISLNYALFWPLIIILIAIGLWIGFYRNRKRHGYAMSATIITVYGLIFLFCTLTSWHYMRYLWPGFLIGPGLGFYVLYLFGDKDKGLLIPAIILCALGLLFIFIFADIFNWWPVLLIIIGVYIILRKHFKK
jgi:hypothetical protein